MLQSLVATRDWSTWRQSEWAGVEGAEVSLEIRVVAEEQRLNQFSHWRGVNEVQDVSVDLPWPTYQILHRHCHPPCLQPSCPRR